MLASGTAPPRLLRRPRRTFHSSVGKKSNSWRHNGQTYRVHPGTALVHLLVWCAFVFLTPQYWSSLNSWGGTAVGSPALLLISSRTSLPTEMSTSSYLMLLLSRIRIISACRDFTCKTASRINAFAYPAFRNRASPQQTFIEQRFKWMLLVDIIPPRAKLKVTIKTQDGLQDYLWWAPLGLQLKSNMWSFDKQSRWIISVWGSWERAFGKRNHNWEQL